MWKKKLFFFFFLFWTLFNLTLIFKPDYLHKAYSGSCEDTSKKKEIILEFKFRNNALTKETIKSSSKRCLSELPSAIIIGAAKSGTSTLLNYLKLNPQIKPALKPPYDETNFFNDEVLYLAGYDWYKKQMPEICKEEIARHDKLVVIEKSIYFNTFASIERIYSYDPNIKLILIVRDPVKCLQSYLTHIDDIHSKRNLERTNLNINDYFESLFKSQRSRESVYEELDRNFIIRKCNYHYSMEKWMEYFEPKNFLILDGEKFVKKPWTVLNQVEEFLQVDLSISKANFEFVEKKRFYCLKISPNSTHCMNEYKGRSNKIVLSDFTKMELKKYYKPRMESFFELVNVDAFW